MGGVTMRNEAYDTIEYRGFNINIYQDEMAEDPRDWDNIGHMACTHSHYDFGDKDFMGKDGNEIVEKILAAVTGENKASSVREAWDYGHDNSKKFKGFVGAGLHIIGKLAPVIMPLYLLDHSGLIMSCGSNMDLSCKRHNHFGCDPGAWDTSMVGFIFCTWDDVKNEYGLGKGAVEKAERYLRGEVETYSQYLEGSVYGYTIEPTDRNKGINCDDSCWGFYGYEWKENGLLEMAEGSIDTAIQEYRESARKMHDEKLETNKFLRECWAD